MTISVLVLQLITIYVNHGDLPVVVDGVESKSIQIDEDANGEYFVEIL